MDINRLRYLKVLSQTENMRQASDILGITPPALSKAIKLLEEELDLPLIIHQGRGLLLTDSAKALLPQVERVLNEVKILSDKKEAPLQNQVVRFGAFEVFSTYFLGNSVKKEFPNCDIEIHEAMPGELEENIAHNNIDIGITYIPIPHAAIDHLKIGQIRMGLFHNNKSFEKLKIGEIPFVVPLPPPKGELPSKIKGLDGWPEGSAARMIRYRVAMMESALALCREGMAIAYLPEFVVKLHNQVTKAEYSLKQYPFSERTLAKCIHQDVFLVKRKAAVESNMHKKVAKLLRRQMVK